MEYLVLLVGEDEVGVRCILLSSFYETKAAMTDSFSGVDMLFSSFVITFRDFKNS